MGIITTDGQTVRFDRQRETITWQSDTLRVVSREATRLFAREQIREVLVDRGAHERLFFFGILPIGAVVLLLITLSQFDNYT